MEPVEETIVKPLADTSQADLVAPVESVGKAGTNYAPDPMLRKREMLLLDQMTGAQKEQQDLTTQHNARMAPEYERAQGMIDQPRPALPPLEQPPEAPDTREQDHKAMSDYFFPMLAFAAVLSKVGGADMATGLDMLSQGVMGMKMGRDEVAKQSIEKWRNSMESVKEKNAALIAQYKAVAEDRSLSMQEQQMRMSLIAAQHGDAIMAAKLKEEGAVGALKVLDSMQKQQEKADQLNQKTDEWVQRKMDDAQRASEHDETLKAIAAIAAGSRQSVAEIGADSREAVAETRAQAAATRKGQKEQQALKAVHETVADIDRVIEMLDQNPGAAGGKGYVNRFVEMIQGFTGKTVAGDNPATRFKTAMTMLEAHMTKAAYGGRISNYEIHKMQEAIGGISPTDSAPTVKSKLREVREILANHEGMMQEEQMPSFDSPEEVSAAVKAGKIKAGDTVQTPWGPYKAR